MLAALLDTEVNLEPDAKIADMNVDILFKERNLGWHGWRFSRPKVR